MFLPQDVQFIIDTFKENSYEAFIVGGCVRDTLLNREINDYDITTNALPDITISLFDKTIPTGLKHGTITVLLNKEPYEITTYRVDGEYTDSRRPDEVKFVTHIKEDLSRRDFTINALAYSPYFGFKDFFNGKDDLEKKLIKSVGDANKRFNEDALRMLRGIRFASQLSFTIEEKTFDAIKLNSELIRHVSYERINVELIKTLLSNNPSAGIIMLYETGLLENIFPSLYSKYFDIPHFEKNIKTLDNLSDFIPSKLTYMIKSCFKDISLADFSKALKKLKCDNKTLTNCISLYSNSLGYFDIDDISSIKLYLSNIDKSLINKILNYDKVICDGNLQLLEKQFIIQNILKNNEPLTIKDLAINGSDLIEEYDLKAGKILGDILASLLLEVFKNPDINEKSTLLTLAKSFIE